LIKMLVTDIDGTLLRYDCSCSDYMKNTILKLNKKGVKVVLASGRMFDGAYPVSQQFGLETPVICYQGAMVRDKDKILWQAPVKKDLVKDIIKTLKEENIHTHLYNNDILYIDDYNKKIMDDYCNGRFVDYKIVDNLNNVEIGNVSKLLAVIYDEEKLVDLVRRMSEKYKDKLTVVRSHKYYCEFTDINATKGVALDFLREYWGFKKEEVMASGDQDNDIDLLLHAGLKIAMKNSSEGLKKVADYICPHVNEDGLAQAIERYILCE